MFRFILCFAVLPAIACFRWTSLIPNDTTMYTCVNSTLVLPWNFSVDDNEEEMSIKYFFNRTVLLALKTEDQFIKTSVMYDQIAFGPQAWIQVSQLKEWQFGVYSIRATIKNKNSGLPSTYTQTARVALPEPAVAASDSISFTELPTAVFQYSTGQFHFQLAFGKFSFIGSPPVSARLTTPSNHTLTSTQIVNGTFVFSLPNPVEGGLYKGKLRIPDVSQSCARMNSTLTKEYELYVDGFKAALVVLLMAQKRQETKLQEQDSMLQEQNSNLKNLQQQLQRFHKDEAKQPKNCQDVNQYDAMNGVHRLFLPGNMSFSAYCDQATDTGGWTVISRRLDGSVDFNKTWSQYESGFGDLHGEFWLGLGNIYQLTKFKNYTLRVDMMDSNYNVAFALYNVFYINDKSDLYRLTLSGYNGSAGDSLSNSSNSVFMTYDKNDKSISGNCAVRVKAGWWYNNHCHLALATGQYPTPGTNGTDYLVWYHWRGWHSLKRMEMKIRPRA